jgi:hypothetical protein
MRISAAANVASTQKRADDQRLRGDDKGVAPANGPAAGQTTASGDSDAGSNATIPSDCGITAAEVAKIVGRTCPRTPGPVPVLRRGGNG